jgi:hypothetical protein
VPIIATHEPLLGAICGTSSQPGPLAPAPVLAGAVVTLAVLVIALPVLGMPVLLDTTAGPESSLSVSASSLQPAQKAKKIEPPTTTFLKTEFMLTSAKEGPRGQAALVLF